MTLTVNRKSITSELKISPNSFSIWAKRKTYPAADIAVGIARCLDTTVEYLVTGESAAGWRPPPRIAKIVDAINKLSDTELQAVEVLAVGLTVQNEERRPASGDG